MMMMMMININDSLLNIIINGVIIFIFSFILNFILFYFIKLGILGSITKAKYLDTLSKNSFLFLLIPFIVSFFIINLLSLNIILLDSEVQTIVDTGKGEIVISGEVLKYILTNFGAAAVFSTSARVAAGLVAKSGGNLALLPKIGVVGGASTGFTATYMLMAKNLPVPETGITVQTNLKVRYVYHLFFDKDTASQQVMNNEQAKSVFSKWLDDKGLSRINHSYDWSYNKIGDLHKVNVTSNTEPKSAVIDELTKNNPNWYDSFIHSPIEKGDIINSPFFQSLNEIITTNVVLHFVILYLLIMLVIIFSSKIILDNNISFDKILTLPLGKYLHRFVRFYVNLWRNTANFWIYFILFCLIFFNFGVLISLFKILSVIQ